MSHSQRASSPRGGARLRREPTKPALDDDLLLSENRLVLLPAFFQQIEEAARVEREKTGTQVLGAAAIQTHTQPNRRKKSPAPLFHAWGKRAYREFYEAYGHFVAAFRNAAEKWRAGDRTAVFPEGSSPPGLPFVEVPLLAAVG